METTTLESDQHFQLKAESFKMNLQLGGRFAGEQTWNIHLERNGAVVRVQTDFSGVLPIVRRLQTSRIHIESLSSLHYTEGEGRQRRSSFETSFDRHSGLVTLRQNRDEVSLPLSTSYQDPVSLLVWLRSLKDIEHTTAQLTGGKVLVQRLAEEEIEKILCHVYFLRPGKAYVYIEQAAPYRLIRLIQPTDFGAIEANYAAIPPRRAPHERGRHRKRVN